MFVYVHMSLQIKPLLDVPLKLLFKQLSRNSFKHVVKFVFFGLRHFFIIPTVILLVTLMKSCFQWQPFSKESVNFTISMFVFWVSFVFQLVNFFKYLTQIYKGVLQSTTTDNESSSRAEIFSIIQSN